MVYVGVDPGKHGAIAVIGSKVVLEVHDFPLDSHGQANLPALAKIITKIATKYPEITATIEDVTTFRRDGRVGAFSFGENKGYWLLGLAMVGIETLRVEPHTWKKAVIGYVKNTDKEVSNRIVKLLFQNAGEHIEKVVNKGRSNQAVKLMDGRSEAVLIAEYGRRVVASRRLVSCGQQAS